MFVVVCLSWQDRAGVIVRVCVLVWLSRHLRLDLLYMLCLPLHFWHGMCVSHVCHGVFVIVYMFWHMSGHVCSGVFVRAYDCCLIIIACLSRNVCHCMFIMESFHGMFENLHKFCIFDFVHAHIMWEEDWKENTSLAAKGALAHCLQRLQNPKWPLGGPKMADRVWKSAYPFLTSKLVLVASYYLLVAS